MSAETEGGPELQAEPDERKHITAARRCCDRLHHWRNEANLSDTIAIDAALAQTSAQLAVAESTLEVAGRVDALIGLLEDRLR